MGALPPKPFGRNAIIALTSIVGFMGVAIGIVFGYVWGTLSTQPNYAGVVIAVAAMLGVSWIAAFMLLLRTIVPQQQGKL